MSNDLAPTVRIHQDLAAERAVLGAILADNTLIANVAEVVHPEDFSSPAHSDIFGAMLRLDQTQRTVDHLTLSEELKTQGKLTGVGGPAYLMGLDQVVPVASNAAEYAKIVRDQATRRKLAKAGLDIQQLASQEVGDLAELLDAAEQRVFVIAEKRREGDLRPVSDLLPQTLELLDKMKMASSGVTGVSTGYVDLDLQLTGLHGGELIVLAARPGIGKTSLAMNIALHVATKEKKPAGIFSLEMPADQLLMRLLASHGRVDMKKLRGGQRLSASDEEKFQESAGQLYDAPLFIDDTGSLSPFDLRAKARRLKQKHGELGVIVIDYLQLMHLKGAESRQLEISEISRSLKALAKELSVPIIALSQLNRKVEERKGGKPMLSDLRESGAIEQDADVVMFIHREEEGGGEEGAPPPDQSRTAIPVELIVAKQRNGPVGSVDLIFLSEFTRFESRAKGDWS